MQPEQCRACMLAHGWCAGGWRGSGTSGRLVPAAACFQRAAQRNELKFLGTICCRAGPPHALSGPEVDWVGGAGGGTMPVLVYHTMPAMAHATPTNFLTVMVSPKNTMPLVTMNTVFKWPTTLYVRGEVAPMNR